MVELAKFIFSVTKIREKAIKLPYRRVSVPK